MSMYSVWLQLLAVKNMFVPHLSRIKSIPAFKEMSDGSYEVRNPEGFVAVDHAGNAIKLIDRLTFSRENFLKQEQ